MSSTQIARIARAPKVEDFPLLFNLISSNVSLQAACEKLNLHYPTVQSRLSGDKDLANDYMLARSYRADILAERVLETAEEVLKGGKILDIDGTSGGVEARAGKVAMDGFQWAAAQLGPQKWGQATIKQEITGKDGRDINIGNQVVVFMLPDNGR
jgi:hypothetical protein